MQVRERERMERCERERERRKIEGREEGQFA